MKLAAQVYAFEISNRVLIISRHVLHQTERNRSMSSVTIDAKTKRSDLSMVLSRWCLGVATCLAAQCFATTGNATDSVDESGWRILAYGFQIGPVVHRQGQEELRSLTCRTLTTYYGTTALEIRLTQGWLLVLEM